MASACTFPLNLMASFSDAIKQSAQNFLCAAAQSADPYREWMKQTTSGVPGLGAIAQANDKIADQAATLFCDNAGASGGGGAGASWDLPSAPPGQCDAVLYRFSWEYTRLDGLTQTQDNFRYWGPIGEAYVEQSGGRDRVRIPTKGKFDQSPSAEQQQTQFVSAPLNTLESARVFNIERTDGQPDNCGQIGDQPPPTGDDNITYDGPDGPIDIDITFKPRIPIYLPDGGLRIPIEVCLPGSVCLDLVYNAGDNNITFNFGGQPGSSNCCPPVREIEEENEDDPPPPEGNTRYTAVLTTARVTGNTPNTTEIGDGNSPSLFVPRLGVIRYIVVVGKRRTYTVDYPIKQLNQINYVPENVVAYGWVVTSESGFAIESTGVEMEAPE